MAWSQEFPGAAVIGERAERAWRLPMGAVSPLWAVFGAAAGCGLAYWWATNWTRAVNIEALASPRARPQPAPQRIEILAEPVVEPGFEPTVEAEAAPAAEPEAPIEPAPAVAEVLPPDDLTRMTGIGPKLSEALAARGVTRFAQIAAWTEADLAQFDADLSLKGRAVREAWVAQAKRLAAAN